MLRGLPYWRHMGLVVGPPSPSPQTDPFLRLVEEATKYLHVREEGPNHGPEVEAFQQAVDGKAEGEPYCAAFVNYVIQRVEQQLTLTAKHYKSESVLLTWIHSPTWLKNQIPAPGKLMCWQKPGTTSGHIGIVETVVGDIVHTIEGNVKLPDGKEGVGRKTRPIQGTVGVLSVLGFLSPWDAQMS